MNKILIIDSESDLNINLINNLLNHNYSIKLLTENTYKNQVNFNSEIEIITKDLNSNKNLDQIIFKDVNKIINLVQHKYPNLTTKIINSFYDQEKTLFDFTQNQIEMVEKWTIVNDVVMGGVSESQLKLAENNAIFTGFVSVQNNGGFASIRAKNFDPPLDLSDYEGISLRVKGDGKRYKFITRCEGKYEGISYCYSFDTLTNIWLTINIPFQDLIPVFRAKTVKEAGEFSANQVYSCQLMISKFEYDTALNPKFSQGFFALEIESIKVYGHKIMPQLILLNYEKNDSILNQSNWNYSIINAHHKSLSKEEISDLCLEKILYF